jgi:hypothetical protein
MPNPFSTRSEAEASALSPLIVLAGTAATFDLVDQRAIPFFPRADPVFPGHTCTGRFYCSNIINFK